MTPQYNPYFEPPGRRPRVRFSRIEVQHLAVAVLFLTVAFAFVLGPSDDVLNLPQHAADTFTNGPLLLAAFGAVSSGFVLHELAHKVVAQRYGHWAEFRAQFGGLAITLAIAVLVKAVFAAPGAVIISGRVTPKENGVISLVGPGTNLLIAAATFPLGLQVQADAAVPAIFSTVATINALLAVFNLIPVGPLDGRKVWRWNKVVYFVALAVSAVALVACFLVLQPFQRWE